jgi:hypothetical protein
VTQLRLHIDWTDAVCQKDGGIGMAETMRGEVQWELGLLEQALHRALHIRSIERRARFGDNEPRR